MEDSENHQNNFNQIPQQSPKKQIPSWIGFVIIVVVIVLLFGGVFAYQYFFVKPQSQTVVWPVQSLQATEDWKTVNDNNFGVNMRIPGDWQKIQYPENIAGGVDNHIGFEKRPDTRLQISRQILPTDVSYDDRLKQLAASGEDPRYSTKSENITIDGKSAFEITEDFGSLASFAVKIYVNGGSDFYQLVWSMSDDYFNNNQNEVTQILQSIHFTK